MKSVDAHLADILEGVEPLAPIHLSLLETLGCVLAEDVVSAVDLPPFDNSSMDGYAVVVADVAGASTDSPVRLPVAGDIAAGSGATRAVAPGTTIRIMTGAPVPAGAQAVIPQEWTNQGAPTVAISREPSDGANIRRRGEDVRVGDVVLTRGTTVGPTQIGLLAAVGRERVSVHPRPRVVVFSTGSELVEPGAPLGAGQIHDSNSYLLTEAVHEVGAIAYRVAALPDDPGRLLAALEDQLMRADVVVTSGGVSVGAYDVVKEALSRSGTVEFTTVAMQPGKPQGQGTIGAQRTPIITLPGNPVSAFVSFEVFVRPLLRRLSGANRLHRPTVRAVLTDAMRSPSGRRQFMRATLGLDDGHYVVRPVGGPGSHLLGALARANALIVVPEEVTEVAAGDRVTVMVLENPLA